MTVLRRAQLQEVATYKIEALILSFYTRLMRRFLADRVLIPPEHLVELRCENLEEQPLDQMRRVYDRLGLPCLAQAEPGFRSYLDSVAGYKKNEHWGFAFDEWGYQRLEPSSLDQPEAPAS